MKKRFGKRIACALAGMMCLLTLFHALPARAEEQRLSNEILSFETENPVLSVQLLAGTPKEEAGLPETLRAVVRLESSVNLLLFVQAQPSEEEQYFAYAIPEEAGDLYAQGQRVKYTLYNAKGEKSYRCFGALDGGENAWYACDEFGQILGTVIEISVTWTGAYNHAVAGIYPMDADLGDWIFAAARPYAMLTVLSEAPVEITPMPTEEPTAEPTPEETAIPTAEVYETAELAQENSPEPTIETEEETEVLIWAWIREHWWIPAAALFLAVAAIIIIICLHIRKKKQTATRRWWENE